MKFYEETVLPWAINRVMSKKEFTVEREKIVPLAFSPTLSLV